MFGKLSVHIQPESGGFDPGGVEPLEVSEEQFIALFRAARLHQECAAESEVAARRGQHLCDESLFRTGIRPRRRAAAITGSSWPNCIERCGKCCARPSRSADLRFPIMSMPTARKDFFNFNIESMARRRAVPGVRNGHPAVVLAGRSSHYCSKCQKYPNRTI